MTTSPPHQHHLCFTKFNDNSRSFRNAMTQKQLQAIKINKNKSTFLDTTILNPKAEEKHAKKKDVTHSDLMHSRPFFMEVLVQAFSPSPLCSRKTAAIIPIPALHVPIWNAKAGRKAANTYGTEKLNYDMQGRQGWPCKTPLYKICQLNEHRSNS